MTKKQLCVFALTITIALLLFLQAAGCARPQPPAEPEEEPRVGGATQVEGVSQGDERGYAHVTLTMENDRISDVAIVEFDGVGREKIYEDYHTRWPYLEDAHNELAQSIAEQNTWDVDIVSGATGTSVKVREAARFALARAGRETAPGDYFDGTFMGVSDATDKGWGIAWVTLKGDEITGVRLEATTPAQENGEEVFDTVDRQVYVLKDEEYPWEPYHEAQDVVAAEMAESQSTDVDTYSGATGSSMQWMQAAERALGAASTR